jgi:hypothetical protein
MASIESEWHSPPESCVAAFTAAYTHLYTHGYTPVVCPCCRTGVLRLYYRTHEPFQRQGQRLRRGGSWLWCPDCKAYDHASALIPAWWPDTARISVHQLFHAPVGLDAYWPDILAKLTEATTS